MSRGSESLAIRRATRRYAPAAASAATLPLALASAAAGPGWLPVAVAVCCAAATALTVRELWSGRGGAARESRELNRLQSAAFTDSLTGLKNTRAFQDDIAAFLAGKDPRRRLLSLVMIDMDGLKKANDTLGHQAGDEMIGRLADALRRTLRLGDHAYRIGGDEFAVLLPSQPVWGAFRFAQRLQATLAALPAGERVTVSAGVAEAREHGVEELVRAADLALIAAKRGRRGVLIYTDDMELGASDPQRASVARHVALLAASLDGTSDRRQGARSAAEAVSELSALVGRELGLGDDVVEELRLAGLIHGITPAVPLDVLTRRGPLADADADVVRRHVALAREVADAAGLAGAATWILGHHEHPDGSGLPLGLEDARIPLPAAVLRVTETFTALAGVDGRGDDPADAVALLDALAGTLFRADCVAALRRLVCPAPVAGPAVDDGHGQFLAPRHAGR